MSVFATIGLGIVGFLLGHVMFSGIDHWVAAVYAIAKEQTERRANARRIALVTFRSWGPWFAIAVALVAYHVHSQPWAVPIAVGAVVAITFFTSLAIYLGRQVT